MSIGKCSTDWAVQNQKIEAVQFIIDKYGESVDMLQQNERGRGALTEAFQTSNTDLIDVCLSHPSATEEKLLNKMDTSNVKISDATTDDVNDKEADTPSVTHEFTLSLDEKYKDRTIRIRELPITNADNPFGSDTAPEDDTTGLGIWAASLLLSRYVLQLGPDVFSDKVVIELGCGCAIPGITAATYCMPKSVYVTDINTASLDNAKYNCELNGLLTTADSTSGSAQNVSVCCVNWIEPTTFPPERADIILGSDLVYDSKIISILIPAITGMLTDQGQLFYSCLASERDGMDEFVPALAEAGIVLVDQGLCPDEFYENPLSSQDGDEYVLHFYEMCAKKEHLLFRFQRLCQSSSGTDA